MDWVANEGVDINWDVTPVSSPVTVLSQRGEFNKDKGRREANDKMNPWGFVHITTMVVSFMT